MAKLLILKVQKRNRNNDIVGEIGDVVEAFEDGHRFSDAETDGVTFETVTIPGTLDEVISNLWALIPSAVKTEMDKEGEPSAILIEPKYHFRVSDKTKTTVAEACECNLGLTVV